MTIFSTLRSRRFAHQNKQSELQMLAFRLQSEWFALPILAIQKVIPLGKIYGDPKHKGIGLTNYNQQELLVIDIGRCIFNYCEPEFSIEISESECQRYLIVIEDENANFVGIPTDFQPVILRVDRDNFKSLPEVYLQQGNIQCVSSQVIELPEFPLIFLLETQQLTKAQFSLMTQVSNSITH
jgi:purine-binding chemotaxis protein CheW